MKIVIAGGSGFIGKALTNTLLKKGHEVVILSRKEKKTNGKISYVKWLGSNDFPENEIVHADAFINLAGVSINEGRWTAQHQKEIYVSRMTATDELLRILCVLPTKPSVLVNASAIGIYPVSNTAVYTEKSKEIATDFLAKTVHDWEKKAAQIEAEGVRVAFVRFGVVLGNGGGALPLMVLPYRLFVGGTVGSGEQWMSWVHVQDVARAIAFAVEKPALSGPINVTSPFPMRMKSFGKTIGLVLHRPHWFPVPSILMKLALGQKSALVLKGQHVLPEVLTNNGFEFLFPTLDLALEDLLKRNE
ncbi:TIGR01777 family oxidoreductase [Sporosarcina sp. G11-34]|uniref:TIGR01777 family oxidoreductase n=1 Tax=Sporosarcina sp. G11-34 TaxID=2849605 RepID=UPI0022A9DD7E|nr:TIGR01777 family oxidoreductase [Sporosarcina sp. G11-34]MCZ2260240.1 TIGR01777 family oxidoreductase [Sporosarcina sp. G11-34]